MLNACVRKFDVMGTAQTFLETPPKHFANGIMVLQWSLPALPELYLPYRARRQPDRSTSRGRDARVRSHLTPTS